jgi:hypothetical protein
MSTEIADARCRGFHMDIVDRAERLKGQRAPRQNGLQEKERSRVSLVIHANCQKIVQQERTSWTRVAAMQVWSSPESQWEIPLPILERHPELST